jgi:hypothetical protein
VLHCVEVADRLGDAGTAIDHARQVDLDKPPVYRFKTNRMVSDLGFIPAANAAR